jgi:uncharacterized protein YdhG (YjbR/CyaY superfamily)
MKSLVATVDEYMQTVPADRKADLTLLLELVRSNMPEGYQESMTWGMPGWEIPLETYPDTYNKKPLMYAAVASQKNNLALYIMGPYLDGSTEAFTAKYEAAGKKPDMGKSCIRFKRLDDLALDVIAESISSITPEQYIKLYEAVKK